LIITPAVYNNIGRPLFIVFTLEPFYGVPTVAFTAMGFIVISYERRQKKVESKSRTNSLKAMNPLELLPQATSECSSTGTGTSRVQSEVKVIQPKESQGQCV
jgi:hypothetical protein